jgi:hypothetical protein
MRSLIIPGILAVSLWSIVPASAQTTATPSAGQSDYDRVMSGVDSSTEGVLGEQPTTKATTTTTKTVSGPLPVTGNTGFGIGNMGGGVGYGGVAPGMGVYPRVGEYGTNPANGYGTANTGSSTTTTTTTATPVTPAQ